MLKQIISVFIFVVSSLSARAGTWTRVDEQTLKFEGVINGDEYNRFFSAFDDKVKILIVDSGGGETAAAMKIGIDLHHSGIEIRVNHWCLSSCANYFFIGAQKRIIDRGIVGFHGNVQACFGGKKWVIIEKQLRAQGLSEKEIEVFHQDILRQIDSEAAFVKMVGVSQYLFNRSCELDKGMKDGKQYAFLLPLPTTFEKYGVTGVLGNQDATVIREFPDPLALD